MFDLADSRPAGRAGRVRRSVPTWPGETVVRVCIP